MPQPSAARLHEFEVVSNERVAEGLFRLVFRAPDLASSLEAGQFVNIHVPGDPSQIVRIPVSFSGTNPADGTVETVYAVVGDGTRRMSLMRPGDTTNVLGPCGHGWRVCEAGDRALIVAGGVGITPDYEVALSYEQTVKFTTLTFEDDPQMCKAVAILTEK